MKVLVAVDESEFSDAAVAQLESRPWPQSTEIVVLSVVELGLPDKHGWHASYISALAPFEEQMVAQRDQHVKKTVERLSRSLPACSVTGKVLQGTVREVIVDEAVNSRADIIMMGSQGRKGLNRLILGSVAESVMAQAPCVVEIVKMVKSSPGVDEETDSNDG